MLSSEEKCSENQIIFKNAYIFSEWQFYICYTVTYEPYLLITQNLTLKQI